MNAFAANQEHLQLTAIVMGLLAGLFVLLFGALVLWLRYGDNSPPFVSHAVKIHDVTGRERYVFRPGEAIELRRDFCVDRDTPVQVGRTLRNVDTQTGIHIDSTHQTYRAGCREGGNLIALPDYTPAGRYRYDVSVRWSNNLLHDAAIDLPPVYIEVVR